MISRVVLAVALLALSACGQRKEPEATRPSPADMTHAAPGLDLSSITASVKAGDDFYRHANGAWLDHASLPDDHSSYGSYAALVERRDAQLRALLEKASLAPQGGEARKVGDYYATFLDAAAIEAKGLAPIAEDIAFIRSLNSPAALMGAFGRKDIIAASPFSVEISVDVKNPTVYAVYLTQSGLGLADREVYLDAKFAADRERYKAYIAEILALAGESAAPERAASIFALEERIADAQWERSKRRNRELSYSPRTRAGLNTYAPADWDAFFAAAQLRDQQAFVLREDDAIQKLARLVTSEPAEVWRDYLIFHLLHANADILPQKFAAARAAFDGATGGGATRPQERWRQALALIDRDLGDAVGRLYTDDNYGPAAQRASAAMIKSMRAALNEQIGGAPWMADSTKERARDKIDRLEVRIGRAPAAIDYAAFEPVKGDAYGDRKRLHAFEWGVAIRRLAKPIDRGVWTAAPQSVDLFYDPASNSVAAPAALWQPPYFDPQADAAVNYGAIGALIGHELTHAVDNDGRKTDGDGVLRDWWTADDAAAFRKRAEALSAQLAEFAKTSGFKGEAEFAIDEAAADLSGLSLAYRAYHLSLSGSEAPVIDGLTGDQRFFLAWAQIWRRKVRDEQNKTELGAGSLPPAAFRVNGVVRNFDAWHAAFHVTPGDALYLPPAERVQVWRQ